MPQDPSRPSGEEVQVPAPGQPHDPIDESISDDLLQRDDEPAREESAPAGDTPPDETYADDAPPEDPQPAANGEAHVTIDLHPDAENEQPARSRQAVIARYGLLGNLGRFRHNLDALPRPDDPLVVRTERGVEIAHVVACVGDRDEYGWVSSARLDEFINASGSEYPFRRDGKVMRRANAQDLIDHRHLEGSAKEEALFCRKEIKALNLDMKLISVEHLLGGERIIFNFAAETRIDFRELVRRLAKEYRTRIEMRQVGARDEAKLLADYERCGMRCCCKQFMKDLKPVSMRMAKVQKATLDPSKISGRCGRLMCCLRFEDSTYEQLRAALPRKNTWARTERVVGRVVDTQILTQLVTLEQADQTRAVVANEDIIERGMSQPTEEDVKRFAEEAARAAAAEAQARHVASEAPRESSPAPTEGAPTADKQADEESKTANRRRRRPRGRKRRSDRPVQEASAAGAATAGAPSATASPRRQGQDQGKGQAAPDGGKSSRRRRRRRRPKKADG
jgi:cell fate regulator YaaT (PSP1 superfamily)